MAIEIRLLFAEPRDVLILVEATENYYQEAHDCYADNGDGADASSLVDATALRDSIWECLRHEGFEIIGNPTFEDGKLLYKGEEVTWARDAPIEPVLKSDADSSH